MLLKRPIMLRTVPTTKNHPGRNVNSAKTERSPDHPRTCWGRPSPVRLLGLSGTPSPRPHHLLPPNWDLFLHWPLSADSGPPQTGSGLGTVDPQAHPAQLRWAPALSIHSDTAAPVTPPAECSCRLNSEENQQTLEI